MYAHHNNDDSADIASQKIVHALLHDESVAAQRQQQQVQKGLEDVRKTPWEDRWQNISIFEMETKRRKPSARGCSPKLKIANEYSYSGGWCYAFSCLHVYMFACLRVFCVYVFVCARMELALRRCWYSSQAASDRTPTKTSTW